MKMVLATLAVLTMGSFAQAHGKHHRSKSHRGFNCQTTYNTLAEANRVCRAAGFSAQAVYGHSRSLFACTCGFDPSAQGDMSQWPF